MTPFLPPATLTRLEKAAIDNGFDQELPRQGDWLAFASTHAPLRLWLTVLDDGSFVAALSQANVARALDSQGSATTCRLPTGALGARCVQDIPSLHRLVRRAFQLSKTLPNELLHRFEEKTRPLPQTTEAERWVIRRVGQELFRAGLLDYWEGCCAMTGLAVPELLRASHIKPWADCDTDSERLDVFNGLLLAPHLDAAFDRGFLAVKDDGEVLVSTALSVADQRRLGLDAPLRVNGLEAAHRSYLSWHRGHVFKSTARHGAVRECDG
ncbi:HNH endonuclease [Corallococcus macrosporus]|uniref:HNH nuclease domain-containing protein n=1 Tax=Myxococcus fulvus (strain ATCC BAA-855 / HW-1) TaxID=483219 RepID=F8CA95_MYXFH|nr:HNH endonuclease [Corallococcus macrosporus]AEI64552.1 hypothetical protein LILAB_13225 [Corallococcus macrosporus]